MLMRKTGVNVAARALPALLILAVIALLFYEASPTGFPVAGGGADLVITYFDYSPTGPVVGNNVTLTAAVLNNGTTSSGGFDVAFYIDGNLAGTASISGLAANEVRAASITWQATSGHHDVEIVADYLGVIVEDNEGNNKWYDSFGVESPQFQISARHTGFYNVENSPRAGTAKWSNSWDVSTRSLVLLNGVLYGGAGIRATAINATDGTQIWLSDPLVPGGDYSPAPIVWKNTLYLLDVVGNITAYNITNRSLVWSKNVGSCYIFRDPVISNGMLYVPIGDSYAGIPPLMRKVLAVNATTGAFIWNASVTQFQSPSGLALLDSVVYTTSGVNLYGFNASSGRVLWNYTLGGGDSFSNYPPPTIYDNALYVGGNGALYAFNLSSRQQIWNFSTPSSVSASAAVAYDNVYFTSAGSVYARNRLTGAANWSYNTGNPNTFNVAPPVVGGGMVYVGGIGTNRRVYALDAYTGGFMWNNLLGSDIDYAPVLGGDGTLFVISNTGGVSSLIRAFKDVHITPFSPVDYTQVDRDSVNASVPDVVVLEARLEDGANGVNVDFSIDQNAPTYSYSTSVSNTSVNGVARYYLNPSSSYYAGEYVWSPSAAGYLTNGSRYFNVYGGLNAAFKSGSTKPNTAGSYQSGDTVEVAMDLASMGPEAVPDLYNDYNATASATLTPPTDAPIIFTLLNTTNTSIGLLSSGTAFDDCDGGGANDYVDFLDNLVPSAVPAGTFCGGPVPVGYNLGWTCSAAVCPGQSGKAYSIADAGDSGGFCGSWNNLDFFQLAGFGITAGCADIIVNGWTFNVTGASTERYWYGNYTLATESGTWSASGNASAAYFFSNSSGRSFTVTGAVAGAPSAAPAGGGGESYIRNVTVDATNNIAIEAGANKLTLGKGATEHIRVTINNLGSVPLYDVEIEATGLPQDWVTVIPSKIDTLWRGEPAELDATIQVPDTAASGTYTLAFTAHNVYVQDSYPIELTITGACECPAGEWSECVDGKQSRTNYKCGAETGYVCEQFTEERGCVTRPVATLLIVIVVGAIIGAAAVSGVLWFRPGSKSAEPT
jgi:outer membrane protein assembly factor BamB